LAAFLDLQRDENLNFAKTAIVRERKCLLPEVQWFQDVAGTTNPFAKTDGGIVLWYMFRLLAAVVALDNIL
jgi:hypothetical protein